MAMLLGVRQVVLKGSGKGWSMTATSNFPFVFRVVDIIPQSESGETGQNSEPSIALNPANPMQLFAGSFDRLLPTPDTNGQVNQTPFFLSADAGTTWSLFGVLPTNDKSIAWKADGSAVLVASLVPPPPPLEPPPTEEPEVLGSVDTDLADLTAPPLRAISEYVGSNQNDQPWIRTGPSNHVYIAYNDAANTGTGFANGKGDGDTANVLISTDGGANYRSVPVDKVGTTLADGPAVRLAVNGNTVYAAFLRWTSEVDRDDQGVRFNSQLVVVRSDDGGEDDFEALGPGGNGVVVATPIDANSNNKDDIQNSPLSLGQERVGSNVAIAVDPNNAEHVLVVYDNAPGATRGQLQLVVSESTDGGDTWSEKFSTSSTTRSAQPGVAILANGAIGLLYNNYDPATDKLSQHLLTTTDDFATTPRDITLATESNSIFDRIFSPYLGDFFDLTGIGNTFYGIFSASNANNGTDAVFTN